MRGDDDDAEPESAKANGLTGGQSASEEEQDDASDDEEEEEVVPQRSNAADPRKVMVLRWLPLLLATTARKSLKRKMRMMMTALMTTSTTPPLPTFPKARKRKRMITITEVLKQAELPPWPVAPAQLLVTVAISLALRRRVPNGDASTYKPKGTAGASRRAGPTVNDNSADTDARARTDTTQAVKDKAARVAKLTSADVAITASEMRGDIEVARKALNLFLNSRMIEAERIVEEKADTRLYYALGYALIATIKGFMTFEPADLAIAISLCKDALTIASLLRKQSNAVSNFGRFVRGTGQSPSALSSMDEVQQHAELVFAEATLLKAILGIAYAGDFFAFVSEALNMRNAYGIYRSLQKFVDWSAEKGQDLDEDFKSGVYLGNGMISMILGLVPGKVLKIMEVFGYTGDTAWH